MGKEYGKGKHGIGFKIGVISVAAIASIAILIAILFGFSSTSTDTGSADPSGGGLFAGATVVPSDEDGGVIHGDGFTVETIGRPIACSQGGYMAPPIPSDIKIVKTGKVGERQDFRVDYKCDRSNVRVVKSSCKENLSSRDAYYKLGRSGSYFSLRPEYKTTYVQVIAISQSYAFSATPVYKVSI